MSLGIFEYTYLIVYVLGTYSMYLLLSLSFNGRRTSGIVEFTSYSIYYILNSFLYLYFKTPIISILFNLFAFYLLGLNYSKLRKTRILVSIYTYLFGFIIELLILVIFGHSNVFVMLPTKFESTYTLVAIQIITYILVLTLSKYLKIRKGEKVPFSYWLGILIIPTASLYILLMFISTSNINTYGMLSIIILIIIINFIGFYLYEAIIKFMSDLSKSQEYLQQNEYYKNQLEIISKNDEKTRKFKHDIKNHLIALATISENYKKEGFKEYYNELLVNLDESDIYIDSGNIEIDSIVNYKLADINKLDTNINVDVNIPPNLEFSSYSIVTIIGNLLDNAFTALEKLDEYKELNLFINYDKGTIIIQLKNTFNGNVLINNGELISTKEDRENHGIGLNNIRTEVLKSSGEFLIDYEDNIFIATVLLHT